jgi:hypothetical protein
MAATLSSSDQAVPTYDISDCFVVSDSYNTEIPMSLLERALEQQSLVIIIEPTQLGEETSRWIRVGNCLHKTSVLSAIGCLAVCGLPPTIGNGTVTAACVGLGINSILCAAIYAVSWQFDPCCKYQPATDSEILHRLPLVDLTTASPVVLVRRDDSRRKWLQNTLAAAAAVVCLWRLYSLIRK